MTTRPHEESALNMSPNLPNTLGEILVQSNKLSAQKLEEAIREQETSHQRLGDLLLERGWVEKEDLAHALARQFGIPYFPLGEEFKLGPEEVALVPEALARKFCVLPLKKRDHPDMTLIMCDPTDAEAISAIRSLTGLDVHRAVSTEDGIRSAIDTFYADEAHIDRNLMDLVHDADAEEGDIESAGDVNADQLRVMANDPPVVRFVNLLLMQAIRDRASDIHLEPEETTVRVRLRIDGSLREMTPPPLSIHPAIVTRIKILSQMDIAERRLPLDGRFKFKVQDRTVDVRVSSFPEVFGEKIVMRLLDRGAMMRDMADIGVDGDILTNFQRMLQAPNGIILLTGPTGSGKTSTLYSALNYIKRPELNIQTVEDPVEYLLPGVNQMQIRPIIGLDFASALRSILRQDPDVIMVGEIRDGETAQIAVRASLTGHLVLSTLHTNDAPSAFSRLLDIGVPSYLLTATLRLIIAQRLVRMVCEHCREPFQPEAPMLDAVRRECPEISEWEHVRGKGCSHCGNTGYRGRTAILEYLESSDSMRSLATETRDPVVLRQAAIDEGMQPLLLNGLRKVQNGTTTLEEILKVCTLTH